MPNISINKSDLQDLGISLKDILLAITKSKNSGSDVIKIKKRKRKGRKNPRQPKQPKYSGNVGGGGGGGGMSGMIPRQAPTVTTVVTGGLPDNKESQFNVIKDQQSYIKSQIEDFKRDNEIKMKAQQNQLAYYQDMNRLGMGVIYNKILENPLTKIQTGSFREPEPVDKTDRFGIGGSTDFYDSSIGSGRFEMIDEEIPFQPPQDPVEEQMIDQPDQQDIPDLTTELTTPEQSNLKQETFDNPPEDKPTPFEEALQKEVQKEEKRKAGRPKGSKNKPKEHPMTQQTIATDNELSTRSSKTTLLNPEMTTPDRFAREVNAKESKNQETISKYFTPRKIVDRKPVHLSLQTVDENEPTLVPTPPAEAKASKLKSRLPIPSNRRSKSVDSALIYG